MGILVFLLKFSLDRFDNKTSEAVSIKMIHDEPVYFVDEEDIRNIVTQSNPSKKIGNIDVTLYSDGLFRFYDTSFPMTIPP